MRFKLFILGYILLTSYLPKDSLAPPITYPGLDTSSFSNATVEPKPVLIDKLKERDFPKPSFVQRGAEKEAYFESPLAPSTTDTVNKSTASGLSANEMTDSDHSSHQVEKAGKALTDNSTQTALLPQYLESIVQEIKSAISPQQDPPSINVTITSSGNGWNEEKPSVESNEIWRQYYTLGPSR